jgi:hypothetical protein
MEQEKLHYPLKGHQAGFLADILPVASSDAGTEREILRLQVTST